MLGRAIALVLWAVTLGAGAAHAAETMFATLDVKRLNWKSDEIIYAGRLAVRGASVVSARSILGGELLCDSTGCDHWFHSPPFIRGIMPDKSSQSSQLEDWLELVRIEPTNATSLIRIEIEGELTFAVPKGEWPKRTVKLTTADFILRGGNPRDGRCIREGCLYGANSPAVGRN
jgi:hypothetical protein